MANCWKWEWFVEIMKKVIIFGCGGKACELADEFTVRGDIVLGFSDNNEKVWGSIFHGKTVFPPGEIGKLPADFIVIGVLKAADVIRNQLRTMGVDSERIIMPITVPKIFPLPDGKCNQQLDSLDSADYVSANTKAYNALNLEVKNSDFSKKIEQLKRDLLKNFIDRKKVCIVAGAVLQVLGIRKSKKFDDIDIIMTSDLREVYGSGLVVVNEFVEMHPQNKYDIPDDDIIMERRNYFVYDDFKFMHPYILYRNKKDSSKYAGLGEFRGLNLGELPNL